jgi:hypothetical protein
MPGRAELRAELLAELRAELRVELRAELRAELAAQRAGRPTCRCRATESLFPPSCLPVSMAGLPGRLPVTPPARRRIAPPRLDQPARARASARATRERVRVKREPRGGWYRDVLATPRRCGSSASQPQRRETSKRARRAPKVSISSFILSRRNRSVKYLLQAGQLGRVGSSQAIPYLSLAALTTAAAALPAAAAAAGTAAAGHHPQQQPRSCSCAAKAHGIRSVVAFSKGLGWGVHVSNASARGDLVFELPAPLHLGLAADVVRDGDPVTAVPAHGITEPQQFGLAPQVLDLLATRLLHAPCRDFRGDLVHALLFGLAADVARYRDPVAAVPAHGLTELSSSALLHESWTCLPPGSCMRPAATSAATL